jgi:hypothetical protein
LTLKYIQILSKIGSLIKYNSCLPWNENGDGEDGWRWKEHEGKTERTKKYTKCKMLKMNVSV